MEESWSRGHSEFDFLIGDDVAGDTIDALAAWLDANHPGAGPQVAAALLILSQIFKKPLQEMGQVYYAIDGPWDEPLVDSTGAADFASRAELAGCILDSE